MTFLSYPPPWRRMQNLIFADTAYISLYRGVFSLNILFCELNDASSLNFSLNSAFLIPWPLLLPPPGLPPTHLHGETVGMVPGDPCPVRLLHKFCLLVTHSWKDLTPSQRWEVADQKPRCDAWQPRQTSLVSWKVGAPLFCLRVILWLHPH